MIEKAEVIEAWKEMGGSEDVFPKPVVEKCCNRFGIECDNKGNILAIRWNSKRLHGNVSFKLGKLPEMRRL